ncbi:hypothetical protein N1851_023507 [Merluccius polli]|uniref:Uncharacterized protein n=1 Tax=Merluccius polli TaxID=89951 RepID=A0AA47NXI2_MERPO|nr:hypothetical protein N1851_023507 [Merluccius polli]
MVTGPLRSQAKLYGISEQQWAPETWHAGPSVNGNALVFVNHCPSYGPHRRTGHWWPWSSQDITLDIAALSETRLHGEDSLSEVGARYTFFWKGVPEGTCRNHGVGFAVKSKLLQHIPQSPSASMNGLDDMAHSPGKGNALPPSSVHMHQTLDAKHNIKEDFYRALDAIIQKTPRYGQAHTHGRYQCEGGTEHLVWPKVIGQHGVGKMNHNGSDSSPSVQEHQLVITNTIFQMKNRDLSTTWQHTPVQNIASP